MSLNPTATSYNWNYSNDQKEEFSLELTGTVVSLQEVQAREWNRNTGQPGRPKFWDDGHPVMNIRMGLATADGKLKSVTFMKAGAKQQKGEKPSLHMQLFGLTNGQMTELIGKTIHLWTWPCNPQTGQAWGLGNPRLFGVEEVADTKYELSYPLPNEFTVPELYANDAVSGGQPTAPAPSQIQQPMMQGGYYAPPTAQQYPQAYAPQMQQAPMQPMQQMPMQQMQQVPMQQMPAQAMPVVQAMPPQSAPMPQGMDPAIAQAMQVAQATNIQPVNIYDSEIPF